MNEIPRAIGKAATRLADVEHGIAAGTWRPTPETLTVILRHTLGIVAALEATVPTTATAQSSS